MDMLTRPLVQGWRGNNFKNNGSIEGESGLGVGRDNQYPFGMQWIYPCQ